jgi:hypothetical protein
MVYPAHRVFTEAKKVVASMGERIPVLDLDPFTSSAMVYRDERIKVVWSVQLATWGSSFVDCNRVTIESTNTDPWASRPSYEDTLSYEPTTPVIFDYTEFSTNGDTLAYVPGLWIEHLMSLRKSPSNTPE